MARKGRRRSRSAGGFAGRGGAQLLTAELSMERSSRTEDENPPYRTLLLRHQLRFHRQILSSTKKRMNK